MATTNGNGNGKSKKSEFASPKEISDVCDRMQDLEDVRASDRTKINALFNGQRPYSKSEEEKYQIQINVNWGTGKRIMLDANRQLNNALLHPGTLFNCTLEAGKVEKRDDWSLSFTKNIHIPLQRGRSGKKHHFVIRSRNATVCMHGTGALLWPNDYSWLPRYVPPGDLLIPTDTYCDFTNLRYFGVNLYLTPGELVEMTQGDKVDKGWNQKQIRDILKSQKDIDVASVQDLDWRDQREAMQQIRDQNRVYNYSDAVTKIRMRAFYWQEIDKPNRWYRCIILRQQYGEAGVGDFVYDGRSEPFADSIDHVLNVQYGDANLTAPLKYHSVRGLGVDLYAPVETLNRLRCEFVQSVFESLKMYFKITEPADRDRLKQVVLQQYGFIPDGLNIVPREQRHQIDPGLVELAMNHMREIMQDNSSAFVQNQQGLGGNKELRDVEARAIINKASAMVSGMLQMMYVQEGFYYEELVRRFCEKNSGDSQVQLFRQRCIKDGIPEELLVSGNWRVSPERVLGGGDRTLAQAESQWLLEHRNLYEPQSQQKILRLATSTMLDDPAKGQMLVPSVQNQATDGTWAAENVFGTMMQGVPVSIRTGIDQIGYVEGLLKMMGGVVQRITATNNIGTPEELVGLVTVAQNIGQHMIILGGDDKEKPRVKQYGDALGKMMNLIKGFAQRQAQQRESQQPQGIDAKDQAKAQATIMSAQIKGKIQEQRSQQKQRERMIEFELEQARENMRTVAEIKREEVSHRQKLLNDSLETTINALRGLQAAESSQEKN